MAAEGDRPSWQVSLLWLAGLGGLFYSSYGFSNWLASTRGYVPSVMFEWEKATPFIDWTIIPYWTTNLFYAASLFLCRTRAEFSSHVKRLLTAQLVSVTCFILLPLKFSWPKPDTSGGLGFFYDSLALFDKPFNQAPSLHVALTIILAALYLKILPKWARVIFAAWSALVILSVMTTWQHHFIDIPTGALLGLFCVWLWPADGSRRVTAGHRGQTRLAGFYAAGAALFAGVAAGIGGGFYWLIWPALALGCVSFAYLGLGAAVFDKHPGGTIGWPSRILLWPYLAAARINSRLWTRREPKTVEIADGVYLGRFPNKADLAGFSSVIDLTCEFSRPSDAVAWQCIPLLDLAAPPPATLAAAADAVEQARKRGKVLVVCALGYGRSVATLAVWLTRTKRAQNIEEALKLLRAKRPKMTVSGAQMKSVTEAVNVKTG